MKKDIENRRDVEKLVTHFYAKVKTDSLIGFIFNDVAKVNWEKHLPVMFNFWENVLFYTGNYEGNPMNIHQHLNRVVPLSKQHFDRWLILFNETVDELFEGNKALFVKQRAISIAVVMQVKIMESGN